MAKVLEFSSPGLARKGKPIAERAKVGKLIEFPKRKSANNSENSDNRKSGQPVAPPQFFGCF